MQEQQVSIPANTPLTVTLEAQDWNQILFVINEAPVPGRIVDPLKEKIRQQITTQAAQHASAANGEVLPPHVGNGLDQHMTEGE